MLNSLSEQKDQAPWCGLAGTQGDSPGGDNEALTLSAGPWLSVCWGGECQDADPAGQQSAQASSCLLALDWGQRLQQSQESEPGSQQLEKSLQGRRLSQILFALTSLALGWRFTALSKDCSVWRGDYEVT